MKLICGRCGKEQPPDEIAMWWTMELDGRKERRNPVLACRNPECAAWAESRCRAGDNPERNRLLVGDICVETLRYPEQTKRVLAMNWRSGDDRVVRAICGSSQRKPATERPNSARTGRKPAQWSDDDPIGVKRQRLVKWLMQKPRCVPLDEAKMIAVRKYPS